jgi:hypothetical protein
MMRIEFQSRKALKARRRKELFDNILGMVDDMTAKEHIELPEDFKATLVANQPPSARIEHADRIALAYIKATPLHRRRAHCVFGAPMSVVYWQSISESSMKTSDAARLSRLTAREGRVVDWLGLFF